MIKDDKISVTTFGEKMRLNMNQVSGTFFKKDDEGDEASAP